MLRPVQRLLSERIARTDQLAPLVVPEGESEHSVEAFQRRFLPLGPGVQQDLSVPLGHELVTEVAQLVTELAIVVDLAIENEMPPAEMHWLHRARVKIDDR